MFLYALTLGIYVWRVERPLWPKPTVLASKPASPATSLMVSLPKGDDGFDFLRDKEKLRTRAEQLLDK
jgi:hypothetical protein